MSQMLPTRSTVELTFISLTLIMWVLTIVGVFACARYLTQNSCHIIFKNRHPGFLGRMTIFTLVFLITERPLYFLTAYRLARVPLLIADIGHTAVVYGFFYFIVLATWHMFYDLQHAAALSSEKWMHLINENVADEWILKYKPSLGNIRFTYKTTLCYYVVFTLIACLFFVLRFPMAGIIGGIAIIPTGLMFLYMFHLRHHMMQDLWGIQRQFYAMVVLGVLCWLYACLDVIYSAAPFLFGKDPFVPVFLRSIVHLIIVDVAFAVLCGYPTILMKRLKEEEEIEQRIARFRDRAVSVSKSENKPPLDIFTIFSKPKAFYGFMNHLLSELSYENMLFLIELAQFKQFLLNNGLYVFPDDVHEDAGDSCEDILDECTLDEIRASGSFDPPRPSTSFIRVPSPRESTLAFEPNNLPSGNTVVTSFPSSSQSTVSRATSASSTDPPQNRIPSPKAALKVPSTSHDRCHTPSRTPPEVLSRKMSRDYSVSSMNRRDLSFLLIPLHKDVPHAPHFPTTVELQAAGQTCVYRFARYLFKKYISTKSFLEVNIPFYAREKLYHVFEKADLPVDAPAYQSQRERRISFDSENSMKVNVLMSDLSLDEVFHVFDDAAAQISKLLNTSISRFSPEYSERSTTKSHHLSRTISSGFGSM